MENIINNLESKYLKFKLGKEQRDVLFSIFSFINNPDERQLTLCGKAGTGKTSILLLVVEYLKLLGLPYQLVAPTHKAKQVLSKSTDNDVMTVHQLLALKANINILDLDLNDLKFDSAYIDSIPVNGVLIIDECSMINDDLYDKLIESCTLKNCKIIAIFISI
jgi:ATP-dependent exoDNAse (exonuclease V) alpha subunit